MNFRCLRLIIGKVLNSHKLMGFLFTQSGRTERQIHDSKFHNPSFAKIHPLFYFPNLGFEGGIVCFHYGKVNPFTVILDLCFLLKLTIGVCLFLLFLLM